MHSATISTATPRAGARAARNLRAACSGRKNALRQADRKRVNKNPGNKGFITDSIDEETSETQREHIGSASRYDAFVTSVESGIDNNPATMRFAQRQKL
jgi:hypothetical protein